MAPLVLSDDGLRRARMRRQRLDPDLSRVTPAGDVVSAVVGIQAQDELAAKFSIRARGPGLVVADVDRALTEDRSLVLTWSLRGTRHFHRADEVRWLLGLLGPVFSPPGRRAEQLGIGCDVGTQAIGVLDRALASGGPLTRGQVKELLAPHGVDPTGQAAVHILRRAALEGVICVVPGADQVERYVRLDDWVPAAPDTGPTGSLLARRYLDSYGPATAADFATWSGLGTGRSRAAWASVAGDLRAVDTANGVRAWALASRLDAIEADATAGPVPLRLVGGFDVSLLAYADRRAHVAPADVGHINRGGGMIRPVILADGRAVGTWTYRKQRQGAAVAVAPFAALTAEQHRGVLDEVADLRRFLGRDVMVDSMGG